MAVNDFYTGSVDQGIYAGMVAPDAVPSWISTQDASTWGIVPMGNTIADVDAEDMAEFNNNFPSNAPWRGTAGISAIVIAYGGWFADTVRNMLRSIYSGGHSDYGGNEDISADLNLEVPMYVLRRPPSGYKSAAFPSGFATNDGQETTGVYQDGLPRSIHTYNKPTFVPDLGLVYPVQGNTYITATGTKKTIVVNAETGNVDYFGGEWPLGASDTSEMGCCYDSTRRRIWAKGFGTGNFTYREIDDIATKPWVQVGASIVSDSANGMDFSPDGDFILLIRANKLYVMSPTAGAWTDVTAGVSGSLVGATLSGKMQPRYIGGGRFAVWDNTSNTTVINIISHTGDPYTPSNWSISQLPVAPSNSVTPTVKTPNGTYGRFAYFPLLGIFTVINGANQPIYFYKLAS